ncbi:hypothetical protein ACGFMK_35250 [Amycolatopsis sp. NPDC049252]|uniref:hypothetical protein n=1 Tax=Amycolatopsis sp. NPDC049252 TaxID=3363933 RepID=UPI00371CE4F2
MGVELPARLPAEPATSAMPHELAPKRPARERPVRRFGLSPALTIAVVAAALVSVFGAVALHRPPTTSSGSLAPESTTSQAVAVPSTAPPTEHATRLSAQEYLQGQVGADRSAVEALVGSWVPEVSAKKLGLVAGGIVYDYPDIWADYQRLSGTYPRALLLKSENYATFGLPDYWITVVAMPFPRAADANAWCDSRNIGPGDCLAARLTHDAGSKGNTVTRTR